MGEGQRLIQAAQEAAKRCEDPDQIAALPENDQVTKWAHDEVRTLLSGVLNQCVAMEAALPDDQDAFSSNVMTRMLEYGQAEALTVFNCALFWLAAKFKELHVGPDGTYVRLAEMAKSGELMNTVDDPLYRLFKESE